jgi:hypothetical protein
MLSPHIWFLLSEGGRVPAEGEVEEEVENARIMVANTSMDTDKMRHITIHSFHT